MDNDEDVKLRVGDRVRSRDGIEMVVVGEPVPNDQGTVFAPVCDIADPGDDGVCGGWTRVSQLTVVSRAAYDDDEDVKGGSAASASGEQGAPLVHVHGRVVREHEDQEGNRVVDEFTVEGAAVCPSWPGACACSGDSVDDAKCLGCPHPPHALSGCSACVCTYPNAQAKPHG